MSFSIPRLAYISMFSLGILLSWLLGSRLPEMIIQPLNWASLPTQDHGYEVQIVSRDPFIMHINNFISEKEIDHIIKVSHGKWETSKIYPNGEAYVDTNIRISEMAPVPRKDAITKGIAHRAKKLQGWRGNSTFIEGMKAQRYPVNGFFAWHEDYDGRMNLGNRVTTFMVYLNDDFEGGGTNFPLLKRPQDSNWCSIIDCENEEYPGVTFKPIKGAAVFWENMSPNGSFHPDVRHASLPVKSGQKLGLNIFAWDKKWKNPE